MPENPFVAGGADVQGPVTLGAAPIVDPLAYLVPPTGMGLPPFPGQDVTGGTTILAVAARPILARVAPKRTARPSDP